MSINDENIFKHGVLDLSETQLPLNYKGIETIGESIIYRSCKNPTLIEHIKDRREKQLSGKWTNLYWCIDLHGVILPINREHKDIMEPYAKSIETLHHLSSLDNQKLILWTSTSNERIESVIKWFLNNDVQFDYFNKNEDCVSKEYADFSGKFYFDILLDDKAGFDPETWHDIYGLIKNW
jgi:hypothetical protein